jgi:serine phosphatase RsbU (regulator of sigma subunit)
VIPDCGQFVGVAAQALGTSAVVLAGFDGETTDVIAAFPRLEDPSLLAPLVLWARDLPHQDPAATTVGVVDDGDPPPTELLPWQIRPGSYAGVTLRTDEAEPIGLLWAFDDGEHAWDSARVRLLEDLGSLAACLLRMRSDSMAESRANRDAELRAERLTRLQRATRALSTALTPDEVLGTIVQEAVEALDAQQGTIVLADKARSVLRMRHIVGFADDVLTRWHEFPLAMEVPLAVVARTGHSMYVATREEMVQRYPAVAEEVTMSDRRAWAVAPVREVESAPAGALMVSWTEPHTLSPEDRQFFEAFADLCAPILRRAGAYEHTAEIATALQTSLLPSALPKVEGIDIHARYVPTGRGDVGGDWYDVLTLPGDRLGLIIGDVVGHGIRAAAQMSQIRHALRTLAFLEADPIRVLELFDTKVGQYGESVMATATVAFYDPAANQIEYAEAGHPPALLRRRDGGIEILATANRPPLGLHPGPSPRTASATVDFQIGDTLLLYTDGLIERPGEPIDAGLARLKEALGSCPTELPAAADHLVATMVEAELHDDLALLLLRRK